MKTTDSAPATDPYTAKPFSLRNRIRRLTWKIAWNVLCRYSPIPLHGYRASILRLFGAKVGRNNFIYPDCKIWDPSLLETADLVTIGPDTELYNPAGIKLGHHTIISQGAYLCGATHDYQNKEFTYIAKEIVTGPYAWVCARAIVLPGVRLDEGAVLGAASVASRSLPAWQVYAGNPAQFIKDRNRFEVD